MSQPVGGVGGVFGATIANSSPPHRAPTSVTRIVVLIACAAVRSTRSPTAWPRSSLICLSPSMSINRRESGELDRRARRHSSRKRVWNARRFAKSVSGSVVESRLRSSIWRPRTSPEHQENHRRYREHVAVSSDDWREIRRLGTVSTKRPCGAGGDPERPPSL